MTGYLVTCSGQWQVIGPAGHQRPVCTGTLHNVAANELNPSGLSPEEWGEYLWQVALLFAVVFGVLALKKALS